MNAVRPYSFHIGALVVVENRAVIEEQTQVRLVVAKEIMVKALAIRKVIRQKQCLPAYESYRHRHTLFESASCKNPETSCLESRRKF